MSQAKFAREKGSWGEGQQQNTDLGIDATEQLEGGEGLAKKNASPRSTRETGLSLGDEG